MIRIEGGHPLQGTVHASGSKNAALPTIMAALLTDEPLVLERVPQILDVDTSLALVQALGKRVERQGDKVEIRPGGELNPVAPDDLVQRMRASFIALGPILARTGEAWMPLPGGCAIGPRPVDLHLCGLRRLGAEIELLDGVFHARARRLRGAAVFLDYPSVGATEQVLLAGALAEGETVIINPAREPEVVDLGCLLMKMGADVRWDPDRVTIQGRCELGGARHQVIPDRIEAGTYLLAGAITRGCVTVEGACPAHLEALLAKLTEAGIVVQAEEGAMAVRAEGRPRAVDVTTWPYPGFSTDLQSPMMALLTTAVGRARVRETVFASRWGHVEALVRMGARISLEGDTAVTEGVERLQGAAVAATDLRAGAALVLAALAAQGESEIHGENHIARGYDRLLPKLSALGAKVWEGA